MNKHSQKRVDEYVNTFKRLIELITSGANDKAITRGVLDLRKVRRVLGVDEIHACDYQLWVLWAYEKRKDVMEMIQEEKGKLCMSLPL